MTKISVPRRHICIKTAVFLRNCNLWSLYGVCRQYWPILHGMLDKVLGLSVRPDLYGVMVAYNSCFKYLRLSHKILQDVLQHLWANGKQKLRLRGKIYARNRLRQSYCADRALENFHLVKRVRELPNLKGGMYWRFQRRSFVGSFQQRAFVRNVGIFLPVRQFPHPFDFSNSSFITADATLINHCLDLHWVSREEKELSLGGFRAFNSLKVLIVDSQARSQNYFLGRV